MSSYRNVDATLALKLAGALRPIEKKKKRGRRKEKEGETQAVKNRRCLPSAWLVLRLIVVPGGRVEKLQKGGKRGEG